MKLFFCLCGLLLGVLVCSLSEAVDGGDRKAVPPEWVKMRTQEHVLAEISQVMGAGIPMRMFFLKCDAVGLPDMKPFVPGKKMNVCCVMWGLLDGRWSRIASFSLICPQEELCYEASCVDGILHISAEGVGSENGGDIAVWKTKSEFCLLLPNYLHVLPSEKVE